MKNIEYYLFNMSVFGKYLRKLRTDRGIKEAKESLLSKLRQQADVDPGTPMGKIVNSLWDELNARIPVASLAINSPEYHERYCFWKAAHQLALSPSDGRSVRMYLAQVSTGEGGI